MREQIKALFKKFCEGTEQDKVEVAEALRKPENFDMMRSAEFVQVAVIWAERLGIKKMTDEEEHKIETCPCCGQPLSQEN